MPGSQGSAEEMPNKRHKKAGKSKFSESYVVTYEVAIHVFIVIFNYQNFMHYSHRCR